eukprot:scaffold2270_cov362-Prasinococcus_capsulatus_cf.AAC.5
MAVVAAACTKHENNKGAFMGAGFASLAMAALTRHGADASSLQMACRAIVAVTKNDGVVTVSQVASRAFDNARQLARAGLLPELLKAVQTQAPAIAGSEQVGLSNEAGSASVEEEVCASALEALQHICVNNEICKQVGVELEAAVFIVNQLPCQSSGLVAKGLCGLLRQLLGSDDIKTLVLGLDCAEKLTQTMNVHSQKPHVVEQALGALAAFMMRLPTAAEAVAKAGAIEVTTQLMEEHAANALVQRQACMTLRNVVCRNPDNIPLVRHRCCIAGAVHAPSTHRKGMAMQNAGVQVTSAGAEALLRAACEAHSNCRDVAPAALRDLGLPYSFDTASYLALGPNAPASHPPSRESRLRVGLGVERGAEGRVRVPARAGPSPSGRGPVHGAGGR